MYANPSVMGYPSSLPPQMLSYEEKKKDEFQKIKDTVDALEAIGRTQILLNARLLENYQMVRGQFIFQHYFDKADYTDEVSALTQDFEIPSQLRHYDIISQVINTMSGEWQKRPDIFTVKGVDDITKGEYVREKTEKLSQYVMGKIQSGILSKLQQQGIDVNKTQFESEEEQLQYQQGIEEQIQKLTPPEIQKYMDISWRTLAEIWADNQLEIDKLRFNQTEMDKVEFEDMLTADKCFRHFYTMPNINGYTQETWNPVNTFYHKSPEVKYIEDGDFVGRIIYISPSEIINRYGNRMKIADIKDLDRDSATNKSGSGPTVDMLFDATRVPFKDYRDYTNIVNAFGADPMMPVNQANLDLFGSIYDDTGLYSARGLVQVTECYWKSQWKVGKVTVFDEQTQKPYSFYVDETFDATGFEEIEGDDWDRNQINTIVWTWMNQTYKGIKINAKNTRLAKDVYVDLGPCEMQFRSQMNPYGCKLPVCGQVFNNRNAQSMSLVDLMKPHQIGYNVAMNQLYQIMQREIGKFLIMDVNMIPMLKDWGEKNFEKFMLVAKELGIAPADTSPTNNPNMRGVQQSGQLPKEIDFDESARMLSRGKLAEFFEARALAQVGITPQRLGSIAASETATGVQQAVAQSYAQTESYFTNFSNYKRRCLQMNLEIAQYVQSKEKDVSMLTAKSDFTRAFIEMTGDDLLLRDLQVYVSNNQEDKRILETARQLFIQNNTTDADAEDLFSVIEANSPGKIKEQLKIAYLKKQQAIQAQQEHEQQIVQMQTEAVASEKQKDRDLKKYEIDTKAQVELHKTVLQAVGNEGSYDPQSNTIDTLLAQEQLALDKLKTNADIGIRQQETNNKLLDSYNKIKSEREKQDKEHKLKSKEFASKEKITKEQTTQVREQNKNQLDLANKKHASDMEIAKKQLELKQLDKEIKLLDLENAEKKSDMEIQKMKEKIKLEKELAQLKADALEQITDVKVESEEKLAKIKLETDKKLAKTKIDEGFQTSEHKMEQNEQQHGFKLKEDAEKHKMNLKNIKTKPKKD